MLEDILPTQSGVRKDAKAYKPSDVSIYKVDASGNLVLVDVVPPEGHPDTKTVVQEEDDAFRYGEASRKYRQKPW